MRLKIAVLWTLFLACVPLMSSAEIPGEDEIILRLEFEEGEGQIIRDSGPRELDARITGAGILNIIRGIRGNVTWVDSGVRNNALEFDGETYFAESDDRYNRLTELTVSFWIWQPESGEQALHILGNNARYAPAHPGFNFLKKGSEHGNIVFRVCDGENQQSAETDSLPTEEWAHVAGVFMGGEEISLYINGEKKSSAETTIQNTGFETTTFTIGINRAGQTCLPGMIIDEVKIWDTILEDNEVKELFEFYSN